MARSSSFSVDTVCTGKVSILLDEGETVVREISQQLLFDNTLESTFGG